MSRNPGHPSGFCRRRRETQSFRSAYTLLHGPPAPADFASVDPDARALAAERVRVRTDETLGEAEAVLLVDGEEASRVPFATGSPERPMDAGRLQAKLRGLAGNRLDGGLEDPCAPAAALLEAAGLSAGRPALSACPKAPRNMFPAPYVSELSAPGHVFDALYRPPCGPEA